MSTASETTFTWACDLCEGSAGTTLSQFKPPDGLARFELASKNPMARGRTITADVCAKCLQRPIADLAGFLAGQETETGRPVTLHIREG